MNRADQIVGRERREFSDYEFQTLSLMVRPHKNHRSALQRIPE
jgi:hypothetical protein